MGKLGCRAVAHIIHYKQLTEFMESGITAEHFLDKAKKAYAIVCTEKASGRYPSALELKQKVGEDFDCDTKEPDTTFLIDLLQKRLLTNKINPHLSRAIKDIENKEPGKALDALSKAMVYRKLIAEKELFHSFKRDGEKRAIIYDKTKASGGGIGIPTKWKALNDSIKCWGNGIFHVLAGFTSVGKTWGLAIIADDVSNKLKKDECAFIASTEMQPTRVARRIDCIKFKLNFKGLRDGELDTLSENFWIEKLMDAEKNLVDYGDIILVGKSICKTADDIAILAGEYGAKFIGVDGGYRLDLAGGGDWGGQVKIIERLQEIIPETEVPWVVTTQLGDAQGKVESGGAKKTSGWKVRYAQEWLINPDVVIKMHQDKDLRVANRMEWELVKWRDGDGNPVKFQSVWDSVKMDYKQADDSWVDPNLKNPKDSVNY